MATVIIGAGIIGTSTAYYLSESKTSSSDIHLIESSPELFASASGYAAGFLARDWFSPPLSALGALSFDLHKQLAEVNSGEEKWGYSCSTAYGLEETVGETGEDWLSEGTSRVRAANTSGSGNGDGPAWLTDDGKLDVISTGDTTAQVDPLRLCQFLMSTCLDRGVQLHQPANAVSVSCGSSGAISSVHVRTSNAVPSQEIEIPCKRLVLAAGAWTPKVFSTLFPESGIEIPVTSLAGHSLLLRSPHWPPSDTNGATSSSSVPAGDHAEGGITDGSNAKNGLDGDTPNEKPPNGTTTPEHHKTQSHLIPNTNTTQPSKLPKAHQFPPGFFIPNTPSSTLSPSSSSSATTTTATTHALFTTDPHPYSPELFSRLPHHIYLAGLNSSSYPLPRLPTERVVDQASIDVLRETAIRLLGRDVVVEREAVCWRPVVEGRGAPVVGAVNSEVRGMGADWGKGLDGEREENEGGVWVAAGHGAWGISLSLGTGRVVADLVEGREARVDISRLGL